MEPDDIIKLSEGLSKNEDLLSLDLSYNALNNKCSKILFKSLHAPSKIRELNISHNELGD
jgi:Ran GTPase-activating protein (RanGAP) involved in mRNA processing and transport